MHQEGNGQEEAADHDEGADGVGVGNGHQAAAHGDDGDDDRADGQGQTVGQLNAAGGTQQHQNVRRGLELGGQHAHVSQHDAQGGDDAGGLAVAGLHDLGHGDLVGLADLAGDEVQQDDADGRSGKGDGADPGTAGIDDAGGAGDTAAAAPGGKQAAHQNDEGNAVSAGDHVVCGLDLLLGKDQTVDHQ